jgi:small subunit ribosomal protein S14
MAKKSDIVKFTKKQKFSTREKNRCGLCGRSRAFIRVYGMCRICFRERALNGELPGVKKASW